MPPLDPTLDDVTQAAAPPAAALAARVRALERRLDELSRHRPPISVSEAAPTAPAPDGTLHVDTATPRLYVRAGGAWHHAGLT